MSAHRTAGQRRALNQVWNGAGIYGFEPLFLSLNADGTPNLYLNTIVGCVRKWYGEEGPAKLFETWAGDRRQALLDDLAWLALESAVYQRELPRRPILADLRRDWAVEFFDREHTLSRQEWMAKNQLSYTMQSARWRAVLGKRPLVMTPYETRLSAALALGPLEEGELFPAILEMFARFRLFDGKSRPPSALRLHLTGRWAGVMTRLMPTEIVHTDVADLGHGSGPGEGGGPKLDTRRAKLRLKEDPSSDRRYIESCFGPSLLPQQELAAAEQKLCTGLHLGCHLWYTAGVPTPERAPSGEAKRLAQQAQLQQERSRAAFSADAALYQNAIRRLTEQIQNCLQVHSQAEEETARCGVPVRVSGFSSLRGYTVLRVFKGFSDSSRQVFRYFATGWNRDGLALRAAGELLEAPPEQKRLLLLLTDASPNDSRRIPPGGKYPFGRDYADAPAVEDAAREVRALGQQGIRVGAVFMGPGLNAPAAETIYGKSLARIRSMDQLAAAAGALIQGEIRELE